MTATLFPDDDDGDRQYAPWAVPLPPPETRARRTDPGTSHEAARSVTPKVRASQQAVHAFLLKHGPATDEEWVAAYQADPEYPRQSVSGLRSRRNELHEQGRVRDTGQKATLQSGRRAIIWRAVPDA